MDKYIGIDIGGTKCSVVLGDANSKILDEITFATTNYANDIEKILVGVDKLVNNQVKAIGISVGGPLDSKAGVILSPPNLKGWDHIEIVTMLEKRYNIPVFLQNDADACAVAEWLFGAGVGSSNMIFLTFGTGMGAGLILNDRLYSGSCDMAGEVGHIRLYDQGHLGYGKNGSFEGYCSGGGIAQYGYGTAKEVAEKARSGDERAISIYNEVGMNLGKGLAILVDILNPETIVIGSIFERAEDLIRPSMEEVLNRECLSISLGKVKIVPAKLGDDIGRIASLSVAINNCKNA